MIFAIFSPKCLVGSLKGSLLKQQEKRRVDSLYCSRKNMFPSRAIVTDGRKLAHAHRGCEKEWTQSALRKTKQTLSHRHQTKQNKTWQG